jgi:hypothetical protein
VQQSQLCNKADEFCKIATEIFCEWLADADGGIHPSMPHIPYLAVESSRFAAERLHIS